MAKAKAKRETAVQFEFDPDQCFQNGRAAADVESVVLGMRTKVGFGIEAVNGEIQAHGSRKCCVLSAGFCVLSSES